jgi:hypothetical protein
MRNAQKEMFRKIFQQIWGKWWHSHFLMVHKAGGKKLKYSQERKFKYSQFAIYISALRAPSSTLEYPNEHVLYKYVKHWKSWTMPNKQICHKRNIVRPTANPLNVLPFLKVDLVLKCWCSAGDTNERVFLFLMKTNERKKT